MTAEQFQRVVSMGVYAIRRGWIVDWRNGYLMLRLPGPMPCEEEKKK